MYSGNITLHRIGPEGVKVDWYHVHYLLLFTHKFSKKAFNVLMLKYTSYKFAIITYMPICQFPTNCHLTSNIYIYIFEDYGDITQVLHDKFADDPDDPNERGVGVWPDSGRDTVRRQQGTAPPHGGQRGGECHCAGQSSSSLYVHTTLLAGSQADDLLHLVVPSVVEMGGECGLYSRLIITNVLLASHWYF